MSLALVSVSRTDFDVISHHLVSHKPRYRNLHLREARRRNNVRDLRYLHAMHLTSPLEIEGMISGPGVSWHYRLVRGVSRTQLHVLREHGTSRDLERIGRRFLREIMARIQLEREPGPHYPKRTPGQFYLKRRIPGTPATHRNCGQAVAAGVLDQAFVDVLDSWNLELLRP